MTRSESRQALSLLVGIPGQQSQEKTAGCVSGSELLKAAVFGSEYFPTVAKVFGSVARTAPKVWNWGRGMAAGARGMFQGAKAVAPEIGAAAKAVEGAAPAVEGAATTAGQVATKLPWGHRMLGTNRFMRPFNALNMASTGFSAGLVADRDREVNNAGNYGAAQAVEAMRNMSAWDRLGMGWMDRKDLTAHIAEKNPMVANQFEGLAASNPNTPPSTWQNLKHVLFS